MKNSLLNYIISFVAVLISVSLGILTGIDEVRNGIIGKLVPTKDKNFINNQDRPMHILLQVKDDLTVILF